MKKIQNADVDELEERAERFLDEGKLRRSENVLKQLLKGNPNCLAAHFHLARVYRRTGQYKKGLLHGLKVLTMNKKEQNANLNVGIIYDLLGRHDKALLHYKMELAINPHGMETEWNLGRLYFSHNRWRDASRHLRHCLDAGYAYSLEDTVQKLGFCFYKLRDLDSYIDVYMRYIQLVPDAGWAFANLGCALLRAKDYSGAILRLKRAMQLGTRNSYAREINHARQMLAK